MNPDNGPTLAAAPRDVPDGYVAVPLLPAQEGAPLAVCIVARAQADPVAGHLVLLREMMDAKVYLGCVADAGRRVVRWTEVWAQDASSVELALAARQAVSNAALDERWRSYVAAFDAVEEGGLIRTGAEAERPAPVLLDVAGRKAVPLTEEGTGAAVTLCTDDALLAGKGLPGYSQTTHRYLKGAETFYPVTRNAPTGPATRPASELTAGKPGLVPFNLGGGFLLVRPYHPLTADAYADLVGGAPWEGVAHGKSSLDPLNLAGRFKRYAPAAPGAAAAAGRLVLAHQGPAGRLAETLHLKVRLIAAAMAAVRDMVQRTGRPLLNLAADSFAVDLGAADDGGDLPYLWTARVLLASPGDAIDLAVPGSEAKYFLPAQRHRAPVYRPPVSAYASGRGTLRIPRITVEEGGAGEGSGPAVASMEITFATPERVNPAPSDLVRLTVRLGQGSAAAGAEGDVDLFARVAADDLVAPGEWRFKSVRQRLEPGVLAALRASEGAELPNVTFEVVPLLSSPCDLYALAVLAVRALLVNSQTTLPAALDRTLSLARRLSQEGPFDEAPGRRVAAMMRGDDKWLETLGPQHLLREPASLAGGPAAALDAVPLALWADVLACVARMFPGIGPDSYCGDYGQAPAHAPHRVFDAPLAELEGLLRRTRSLIVVDWRLNREVRGVIEKQLGRLAPPTAARPAGSAGPAKPTGARPAGAAERTMP